MLLIINPIQNGLGLNLGLHGVRLVTISVMVQMSETNKRKNALLPIISQYGQSILCHCGDTHMSFHLLLNSVSPHSSPSSVQHSDLVNSSLTTTANHSLTPSFSVYFHKQRKQPLKSRTTFWKPCPSALPTSQWLSRLTSSDVYKRSHLTSEREFIQKGVTDNTHQERTHKYRRPDCPAT